ncbi:hypothetical protein ACS0TY_033902 [Phlomoides rotata]
MAMGDVPSPPAATTHPPRSNLSMLYYGLVVMGTAAIVLVLYNLIIIKWCTDFASRRRSTRPARARVSLISSFKYKNDGGGDCECAVCLSVFEQGEQVKKLPKCSHCFHAACIDMWLYSHLDCPLCRSPVEHDDAPTEQPPTAPQQHSREILLGSAMLV